MASMSNIAGASITAGVSNTIGAHATAGADNILSTSGSMGANQPLPTTYPVNPHINLRMLEITANMDAFATTPVPERALCGSNTVVL